MVDPEERSAELISPSWTVTVRNLVRSGRLGSRGWLLGSTLPQLRQGVERVNNGIEGAC